MDKEEKELLKKEMQEISESIVDYIYEKIEKREKQFRFDLKEELEKQFEKLKEEILIGVNKIIERII